MIGLTRRQRDLYAFIKAKMTSTGEAPTYKEMAHAIGVKSKARIHVLLNDLQERGVIRRIPFRKQAIELLPQGEAVELHPCVRAAAVEYARRTHTSLSVIICEAVEAYVCGDKAA
jgi:SOS-response transcriptional repressor LexA